MSQPDPALPILEFASADALRAWLLDNHATSAGVWLRIYKKGSGVKSVTFEEVLDEGLCFGWSESQRRTGDDHHWPAQATASQTA